MFKKHILSIAAVVMAIIAVAFKEAPNFRPLADNWYIYNGSATDPQNLASYYSLQGTSHTDCPEATRLCAIKIVNDDGTLTNAEVQALINSENGNTTSSTFPAQSARVDFKE